MQSHIARRAAVLFAAALAALACQRSDAHAPARSSEHRDPDASAARRTREPASRRPGIVYRTRVEIDTAYPPVLDGFAEVAPSRLVARRPGDPCRNVTVRDILRNGQVTDAYLERGVAVRCRMRPGGPLVRIVVRGHGGIPLWADVYLPADARPPVQRLQLETSANREYYGGPWVEGADLNGDGWADLKVRGSNPVENSNAHERYSVFVYDPATRRFVRAEGLSGKTDASREPGDACANTTSGPRGVWILQTWCWRGGRFVLTEHRVRRALRPGVADSVYVYLDSISIPRNGHLELAEIDTLRSIIHQWKPGDPRPSTAPPLPHQIQPEPVADDTVPPP